MNFEDNILRSDEKALFLLRSLYKSRGYSQFKMRKFEEYDLYVQNKDFLVSDSIITFTDTNGKLLALKPDVTLSIIKNTRDQPGISKLYYNENVYRISKRTRSFEEIMQVGVECIGEIDRNCVTEILTLAADSLLCLSEKSVLDISHMGIISEILDKSGASFESRKKILYYISEKNMHDLSRLCAEDHIAPEYADLLKEITGLCGAPSDVLPALKRFAGEYISEEHLCELEDILLPLEKKYAGAIRIDFSVVNDMSYYSGIVFKGFIDDIPSGVLSGGQYGRLMQKMGRSSDAIGFAVYLDSLERMEPPCEQSSGRKMLNIALPKGRLGEKVYDMFEKAGYGCPSILENSRKLIFENEEHGVRYFWVKPSDVSIYVERGAADIGVAGKDILLEYEPDIYELLDLDIGKCRMAVAAPKTYKDDEEKTLRVATKFSNIARNYYSSLGRDIDIIHLNGSIEIAPILGLSDVIVDIVETGTTLKENDLEVRETVLPISARLIANKSSTKFNEKAIENILNSIRSQMEDRND